MKYTSRFSFRSQALLVASSLFCAIQLSSCSVYQSDGRKSFESKVQRSPNIVLTSVDLMTCEQASLSSAFQFKNQVDINERQSLGYEHPQLIILTQIDLLEQDGLSQNTSVQICKYNLKREPLSNIEMTQLIEGINNEL